MADLKEEFNKSKDSFNERKEGLKGALNDTMQDARAKAKDNAREARLKVNRYVQSNPEKSMLMAAAAGAAVGLIAASMMSCKKR